MKIRFLLLLIICGLLAGCSAADKMPPTTLPVQETTAGPTTIYPLPLTIDVTALDDCTLSVSFQEGDAYVDETGAMQLKVTVYTYDLYDMVDIARLKEGDRLILQQQEVVVTTLEHTESGSFLINGGLDLGGYELQTDDNTVFYEIGYSDVKSWYPVGDAMIRVSPEFQYTDRSDLDKGPVIYYPGDFLIPGTGIDYHFTPYNTTITIQEGNVISMERLYTP